MIRSRQEDYQTVVLTIVFAVAIILFALLLVRLAVTITDSTTTTSSVGARYGLNATNTQEMSADVAIQQILAGNSARTLPEHWQEFEASVNWLDYAGYHIPPVMPVDRINQGSSF